MEWVSIIAFGNDKYKMAANMASKTAAVITKISKKQPIFTVFAPRSALLGPRLLNILIITCIIQVSSNTNLGFGSHIGICLNCLGLNGANSALLLLADRTAPSTIDYWHDTVACLSVRPSACL